jgi:hypothetical protein
MLEYNTGESKKEEDKIKVQEIHVECLEIETSRDREEALNEIKARLPEKT